MLFSPKNVKGLGLPKAQWEAVLQTINMNLIILHSENPHILACRDPQSEITECVNNLGVKLTTKCTTQNIRKQLRKEQFQAWCALPHKGKGVVCYQEVPAANKWHTTQEGLTSSEWIAAVKMIFNVAPVRSVPGRSLDGNRCRHCSETETLSHVLGNCPHGALQRTARHNHIRKLIAAEFRKQYTVVEEKTVMQ